MIETLFVLKQNIVSHPLLIFRQFITELLKGILCRPDVELVQNHRKSYFLDKVNPIE